MNKDACIKLIESINSFGNNLDSEEEEEEEQEEFSVLDKIFT